MIKQTASESCVRNEILVSTLPVLRNDLSIRTSKGFRYCVRNEICFESISILFVFRELALNHVGLRMWDFDTVTIIISVL